MLVAGRAWWEETTMTGESLGVEVPGGSLRAGQWGEGTASVTAVHGLTGTQMGFGALAGGLDAAAAVLARDSPGRGSAADLSPHDRRSGPRW
jgi:hypothetical protein